MERSYQSVIMIGLLWMHPHAIAGRHRKPEQGAPPNRPRWRRSETRSCGYMSEHVDTAAKRLT